MRKLTSLILALLLVVSTAFGMLGCKKETPPTTPDTSNEEEQTYNLVLNDNILTLFVGETYTLPYKLIDGKGEEKTATDVAFDTDNQNVAEFNNGIITAKAIGETYVTVTADGEEASCFVSVTAGERGEKFEIRLSSQTLYGGVPVQAYVYHISDGVVQGVIETVEWSVENDEQLSVSTEGIVTAIAENVSVLLKANVSYNGTQFEVTKELKVVPPINYLVSRTRVLMAGTKTYSGETNDKYTSTFVTVTALNSLTGEEILLTGDQMEIGNTTERFDCEILADGKIVFTSNQGEIGTETAQINVKNTDRVCMVNVTVAYAISTIADMDRLSVASFARSQDLADSYVMVNDIDYQNKAIYPIAFCTENKYIYTYQWRYSLDYDATSKQYSCVERENVGKVGYGLSDAEFMSFSSGKGINPNSVAFSGTFDGNGYAIKNAKLMFAPVVSGTMCVTMSVFGHVSGGMVRNLEIDLSFQQPTDIAIEDDPSTIDVREDLNGISMVYSKSSLTKIDFTSTSGATPQYKYQKASFIMEATKATVENVRLTIDYNGLSAYSQDGALVSNSHSNAFRFNVIEIKQPNVNKTMVKALCVDGDSGTAGRVENNLAIGTHYFKNNFGSNPVNQSLVGTKGNWLTKLDSWSSLYSVKKGAATTQLLELSEVLTAYANSGNWTIVGCNTTDGLAPQLINGCSIPKAV